MSKICHNHVLSYLCSFAELRIILRSTAPSTKPENEHKRPQYVLLQSEDISSEWHQQHGDRGDLYHHRCEWIWIWRWMTRAIYFLYPTPLSVLYKYNFSPICVPWVPHDLGVVILISCSWDTGTHFGVISQFHSFFMLELYFTYLQCFLLALCSSIQFYLYSAITIQLSQCALQSPEPEPP